MIADLRKLHGREFFVRIADAVPVLGDMPPDTTGDRTATQFHRNAPEMMQGGPNDNVPGPEDIGLGAHVPGLNTDCLVSRPLGDLVREPDLGHVRSPGHGLRPGRRSPELPIMDLRLRLRPALRLRVIGRILRRRRWFPLRRFHP
jgi:hypothetical protein